MPYHFQNTSNYQLKLYNLKQYCTGRVALRIPKAKRICYLACSIHNKSVPKNCGSNFICSNCYLGTCLAQPRYLIQSSVLSVLAYTPSNRVALCFKHMFNFKTNKIQKSQLTYIIFVLLYFCYTCTIGSSSIFTLCYLYQIICHAFYRSS